MKKVKPESLEKYRTKKAHDIFNRLKSLETKGINIIDLAFGAPGFETPEIIKEAALEALKMGLSSPAALGGFSRLSLEICNYIDRTRGFRPKLDQILIAPGAKTLLFCILMTLINKGDEVITTDPSTPTYSRLSELIGAKVKYLTRNEKDNFKLDINKLEGMVGKKTKVIIINTPHNPTGNVMTNTEVHELSAIAEKFKLFIISDETFNQIIFRGRHTSPANHDRAANQTLIIENLSYTFSMAEWQLSFCVGPKKVIKNLQTIIIDTLPLVPHFIQYACTEALIHAEKIVPEILDKYNKSCITLVNGLNELPGFKCPMPAGSIYTFPDISGTNQTCSELAEYLLENAGLAVLPGDLFGKAGKSHLRISFATHVDNINEGLTRLQESF